MRTTKTFLILISLFLITLISVSALQVVSLEVSNPLCPRESGLYKDKAKNTDTTPKQYTVSLSGSASSWSSVFPTSFILASGEEKEIFTYATPRTETQPGTYDLKVNFVSGADTNSISHSVAVKNCYSTILSSSLNTAAVCPSETARYEVTLSNNGEYSETYALSIEGQIKEKVSLSDKQIVLNRGESKKIIAFVNSPVDSGEYGFSINVASASGRSSSSLPLTLTVNPCYDFNFGIQSEKTSYEMCDRTAIALQLRLENKGSVKNEYTINMDSPNWVRLSRNSIGLMPNEIRFIDLFVSPDYGTEGDFEVNLELVPQLGSSKATTNLDIKVKKCTGVSLELSNDEINACKGTTTDFEAKVKNIGEIEKVFQIALDAPEWVSFNSVPQFTLKPGVEKTISIRALPLADTEEDSYKVKLGVKTGDESSVVANDQKEFDIEVVDIKDCYKPILDTKYTDAVIYYDSSVPIPITITNTGTRRADYSLFLTGNSANFVKLNPPSLSLDPGKSETAYLYVAPNVNVQLGKYNAILTINLQNGQILDSKEFKFEVTDVREKATNLPTENNGNESLETSVNSTKLKEQFTKLKTFVKNNKVPSIVVVVLVIFIILSFVLGWHKSFIEFFEEDFEDESEDKKEETQKEKQVEKKKSSKKKKKSAEEEIKDKVEEE